MSIEPLSNTRHERFAQGVARGLPATRAYLEAGYSAKYNSAAVNANKLLKNPKIRARLERIATPDLNEGVADVQEIQEYLTAVMRGRKVTGEILTEDHVTKDGLLVEARIPYKERTKAAEVLARARGLFIHGNRDSEGELAAIEAALRERPVN